MGYLIEEKCTARLWNPIKASRSGLAFSLFFFFLVDDLVLFANVDTQNCNAINDMLQDFCAKFGQKVSATKTLVFFSPNVDSDLKDNLTNLLGFDSTTNLGKYLGFPLKQPGTWKHHFDFVLDRVKKKLIGWKANLLSIAGRMVLV